MTNLIGQSLGRYHILEQLGEGGMATVYKAYDTRLERDVAVKVIRVDQFAPAVLDRILKRFEREAKALARLTHPNIVHINDYGEQDGIPYVVMDFLPGGTLKQRLGKPIPWQEASRLLIPVSEALGYAHGHGIVHRDVKPSNILLTEKGQPMLTDFGIAKILESEETQTLTVTGVGIGTPEYMAPEQTDSKSVDQRADIYALGIVFYEMVTGRRPFEADTPLAVLLKQASDPLPRPRQFAPGVPEAVEKVLFKALAKKPEDRYQNMGEFATALERLASGQTAETGKRLGGRRQQEEGRKEKEEKTREVPPPPAKHRQWLIKWGGWAAIGGLVVFVALGIALGIGFLNLGQRGLGPLDRLATRNPTKSENPNLTLALTSIATQTITRTSTPILATTPTMIISSAAVPSTLTPSPRMIRADNVMRLQKLTDFQTSRWVECVTFSPNGKFLAWSGDDGIWVYDLTKNEMLHHLTGHSAQVHSIAFDPNGSLLYSGGVDVGGGKVRVWDWMKGVQVYQSESIPPEPWGTGLAISPDGKLIVTDGALTLTLWQISNGTLVSPQVIGTGNYPTFSQNGKWIGAFHVSQGVILFNVQTLEERLFAVPSDNGLSQRIAFSPDSSMVASGSSEKNILIMRISDSTILQKLTGVDELVKVVVFSPDGSLLVSGEQGGTVQLWRVSDGMLLLTLQVHTSDINNMAFSSDGIYLAAGLQDGTVQLWGLP